MGTSPSRAVEQAAWSFLRRTFAACLLATLASCGGGGGGDGGGASPPPVDAGVPGAPYFSFAVGDRWRTLDSDGTTLTTRVTRQDADGFVLRETGSGGSVEEYRLARSDSAFSFVPLPSSDPLSTELGRYDIARFPLRAGATYTALDKAINGFDFDGDGRADSLHVRVQVTVVGFERVTVPAGSFDDALHQRTVITQTFTLSGGGRPLVFTTTADDWYARGVGPVRSVFVDEGDDGQRETGQEVLQAYRVGALSNDTVAPTVSSRSPADGSVGRHAMVRIVFSEDIEPDSLGAGALSLSRSGGDPIPGRIEWQDARTLAFAAHAVLSSGRYVVRLAGTPEDWAGNRLADSVQWTFDIDVEGPVLVSQTPAAGAVDVAPDAAISFTFDEALGPVATDTVFLSGPDGAVPISVTVDGRVLHVVPAAPLVFGRFYSVTIWRLPDQLGNEAFFAHVTSFTITRGDPGRFAFPEALPAFGGRPLYSLRLADLDGDGKADLLASALNAERSLQEAVVLRRHADGTFADQALVLPGDRCHAAELSVVDLDADGLPDVLGARSFCGVHWVQQTATGAWRYGGPLGHYAERAQAIRLVGQARPGIVALGNLDSNLMLLRPRGGPGTTEFEPAQALVQGINTVMRALHVTDVDGDGREDIVLATGQGSNRILMALQRADATFDVQSLTVPDVEHVWLIADFDGDGRADLLLGETNPSTALVLLTQRAGGGFAGNGQRYLLPVRVTQALLADVDGDGRKETVLAVGPDASTVDNLAVFVPRSGGDFTLLPLLQYPAPPAWSAPYPGIPDLAIGDFSGDGMVDLLRQGELMRARSPVSVPTANRAGPAGAMRSLGRLDPTTSKRQGSGLLRERRLLAPHPAATTQETPR